MRPPASYTCTRCLSALRNPSSTSRCAPLSPRFTRSISTCHDRTPRLAGSKASKLQNTGNTLCKREISFMGNKGQTVKNEPLEYRSPDGLASSPVLETEGRPLLMPNNLFHPFSSSPSPEIRRRAAFMKQHAYCPHPDHHQTRLPMNPDDPEARKQVKGALPPAHVSFECPDCGIPVACSEEHWADDYEAHLEICDTLREINEDDHDLRSGRFFPEFEYPGDQIEEAMVNMTNWDTFLFSREFRAINDERSLRQATRLLTYPVTIGSILHELSPYSIKKEGRLTVEGLKSLSGIYCFSNAGNQLTCCSSSLYPASTEKWCRRRYQRAQAHTTTNEDFYPWCTSRIIPSKRSLGATRPSVPPSCFSLDLHWPREHGKQG